MNKNACFNLMAKAIGDCFRPLRPKENKKRTVNRRIAFAKSRIVEVWTDCSDNFEYEKLKKEIINYNKNL